jgi:hypothetical protein
LHSGRDHRNKTVVSLVPSLFSPEFRTSVDRLSPPGLVTQALTLTLTFYLPRSVGPDSQCCLKERISHMNKCLLGDVWRAEPDHIDDQSV